MYTWDGQKLTEQRIRTGITDGQFTELVSGDVKVGDQLVTGIVIPVSQAQRNQANQSLSAASRAVAPAGSSRADPVVGGGGGGGGGGGRGGGRERAVLVPRSPGRPAVRRARNRLFG